MTASDRVLIHQCSTILLHNPNEDDISTVAEALRLLAEAPSLTARCVAIGAEYESLVNDAKRKGAL